MGLDSNEKILADHNDVFADIMNVFLFGGKQVIREEQLENSKDRSQYKVDGKLHEQERDVSKFYNGKEMRIAFLGIEHQNYEDTYMPLRVISYDGSAYRAQLLKGNEQGGYKKKTKPFPVITLILYFGTKHWSQGKSLYEVIDVPEEIKGYVNDYKINLLEVAFLEEEDINKFQSDFKIIADYFVQKRKGKEYIPLDKTIKHVDEVLKTLEIMSGDERYQTVLEELNQKQFGKGEMKMCEIYDQILNKGIQQEKANTEKERKRAEAAQKRAETAEKENERLRKILLEHNVSF
ncbi:Putative transposase, YhgA-like [Lachnospiraceae bacterium G41]|nr:Putative transposase, YhgA-like [Lachnospiraceae bacterium G41]